MKKYSALFLLLIAFWSHAHSQTIQVMTEQLTALGVFRQSLFNGYAQAAHGLQNIGNYQEMEYEEHQDYIKSLSIINKNIVAYDKSSISTVLQPARQHRPGTDHHRPYQPAIAGQGKAGVSKKYPARHVQGV